MERQRLRSAAHALLEVRRITSPLNRRRREHALDGLQIVTRELNVRSADVLLQTMQLRGARDGNDPRLLREQPGQRDLRRRGLLSLRDRGRRARRERDSPSDSPASKRGTMLRKSDLSNFVFSSILPVRKPLPSGLNGTKPIPSSSQRREDFLFGLSPPQRVLALERRDRLDRVRSPDRLRAGFGQAEVLDLALPDQLLHRAGHVLDRHVRDRRGADRGDRSRRP